MKTGIYLPLKEYFWNSLKKITKNFSNLTVDNLGHGYVKCCWKISSTDNFRIKLSNSCFFAIRLFDISNKRNKNNSTCIMKEIQINKFHSSITFPIPINKGVYFFELGYRKKNGEWRKIADQTLNLGYKIKKALQIFDYDNWFISNNRTEDTYLSLHEEAYQLSFHRQIGGSENTSHDI